jgi:hypothetical protein
MLVYINGRRKTHRHPRSPSTVGQNYLIPSGAFDVETLGVDIDVKIVGCSVDVTHSLIYLLFSTRRPTLWIGILLALVLLLSTFTFTSILLVHPNRAISKILTLVDHRDNVLRELQNAIELLVEDFLARLVPVGQGFQGADVKGEIGAEALDVGDIFAQPARAAHRGVGIVGNELVIEERFV